MRIRDLLRALFACVLFSGGLPAKAQVQPDIVRLPLEVGGSRVEVLAHVYRPPGDGPFPLVIYSHGRAGSRIERLQLKFPVPVGHGNYWLRKGVAVVAPVRPGYGDTGGADLENSGALWQGSNCYSNPDYERVAEAASRTVTAVHAWAQQQPWIRKDRVLLVGQSVGGMTTVAAAAKNLPGVVAAVNFAGGSGGHPEVSPGKSCQPQNLTALYRKLGAEVKVPSLWLYAENDMYWGPEMPRQWHEAFGAGGSSTSLVMTPPLPGHDGHSLLMRGGPMWSVPLNAFVARSGLLAP